MAGKRQCLDDGLQTSIKKLRAGSSTDSRLLELPGGKLTPNISLETHTADRENF
jgi:hypothetical protein